MRSGKTGSRCEAHRLYFGINIKAPWFMKFLIIVNFGIRCLNTSLIISVNFPPPLSLSYRPPLSIACHLSRYIFKFSYWIFDFIILVLLTLWCEYITIPHLYTLVYTRPWGPCPSILLMIIYCIPVEQLTEPFPYQGTWFTFICT